MANWPLLRGCVRQARTELLGMDGESADGLSSASKYADVSEEMVGTLPCKRRASSVD